MLSTKSKFSISLVPIANPDRSSEFASSFPSNKFVSFASHVPESHEEINEKIEQNNDNHEMRADDRNILKTFNVGDVKQLHACSVDPFQILMKLNDNVCYKSFYTC